MLNYSKQVGNSTHRPLCLTPGELAMSSILLPLSRIPRLAVGKPGLSLTEALIALGVLALVLAVALPKLITSNQDAGMKANLKTALTKVEASTTQAAAQGELNRGSHTVYSVVTEGASVQQACPDALANGCWSDPALSGAEYAQGGATWASGAQATGLATALVAGTHDLIALDGDGPRGSQTVGQDRLQLAVCVSPDGCTGVAPAGYAARYGEVFPVAGADNTALFDSLRR